MTGTEFPLPYNDKELWREVESLKERVKDLDKKTSDQNDSLVNQLNDLNAFINLNVPPVVNYINNGDFTFNQSQYVSGTVYAGAADDAAHWYWRANNSGSAYTEHTTGVQSGDSLTNALFADDAWWDKAKGVVVMGTRAAIAQPLPKNVAFPASTLFCRFQVKLTDNTKTFPSNFRLRAAIWDNTGGQQKIVEGAVFDLTVNANVPAPGAFTRKYILRVDTNMDFFYSDVLTPSQVTNQVTVDVTDLVNYVTVSWNVFPEAISYKLYRHDSQSNEWRQIAEILNGATSFRDTGGRVGLPLFTPPVANILPRAQALFVNFGQYVGLEFKDAIFNIFVPSNYNYAATTGKQWLRIDVVDETLTPQAIGDDTLTIDKIALGYTNGRFCYSASDLAANATVQATTPPPNPVPGGNDGDGGDTPPNPGGGGAPIRCVKTDTKILMKVGDGWFWQRANKVEVGDYVMNSYGGESRVANVTLGVTSQFIVITTENKKQLWCSPSHPILRSALTEASNTAAELNVGDDVATYHEGVICLSKIAAIEIINARDEVLTFGLEGGHTFIANGIISHNLKPLLD